MPLLFFGLPADELVPIMMAVGGVIIVLKNGGVESLLISYCLPILMGVVLAYMLKKINEIRPSGYTRHIPHKWGVWHDKMRKNHLMPPGKRLYSP